jgi:simple sugar transport system ATP-binding protein
LFITHKLQEVLASADRITVMRRGRIAGTLEQGQADEAALVSLMFEGGTIAREQSARRPESREGAVLLELRGACTRATGGGTALRDVDLQIREGEILGVAGVSGNGQKELSDLIQGLRPLSRGVKRLLGQDASGWTIRRIRQSGVAFVPEDPLGMAAVPGMSVRENLVLGTGRRYAIGVGIDWRRLEADMRGSFQRLGFQLPELDTPIRTLSGGNLQKVVIAREMAYRPRLIIALYPTRGLDVLSATAVRELLSGARDSGSGVLLISEDLEELFQMSDRLLVMFGGAIAGEFVRGDYYLDVVGNLMTGGREGHK